MSIAIKTQDPPKIVEPPRSYPPWLAAQLRGEDVAVPETVIEELSPKVEPWMRQPPGPGKIVGAGLAPPAKYVPPPKNFTQKAPVKVIFKVLNLGDRPIYGYSIRANEKDLLTDGSGEAEIWLHPGHRLSLSTGRESGWTIPHGSNRRLRMTGMVAMDAIFPVSKPTVVFIFPESGQYRVNGVTHTQEITYHSS